MHVDEYFNSWVIRCTFNVETRKFEFKQEMIESSYIVGSKVDSVCEYQKNSLLLSCKTIDANLLLVSQHWHVIH